MNPLHRVKQELKAWKKDGNEIKDLQIKLDVSDSLDSFKAEIAGPPGTPYEGGKWNLLLKIPDSYPMVAPRIRFITQIWHPNICYIDGRICVDTLNKSWLSTMNIRTTLVSIQALLESPAFDDPLNFNAKVYDNNIEMYERTVKYWTHLFANGPYACPEFDEKVRKVREKKGNTQLEALDYLSQRNWVE